MKIKGYTWMGLRTEDVRSTTRFFADVLGIDVERHNDDFAQLRLPSGQVIEIFGPGDDWHDFMTHPVVGFEVEDVRAGRDELEERGVIFLTGVMEWEGGTVSSYFRGPNGHIYEIWQRGEDAPDD